MGPAPMIRMLWMSVLFGILYLAANYANYANFFMNVTLELVQALRESGYPDAEY
jgi:hypothetical protein